MHHTRLALVVTVLLLAGYAPPAAPQMSSGDPLSVSPFATDGAWSGSGHSHGSDFSGSHTSQSAYFPVGSPDLLGGVSPSLSGSSSTNSQYMNGVTGLTSQQGQNSFSSFSNGVNCASSRQGSSVFTSCY